MFNVDKKICLKIFQGVSKRSEWFQIIIVFVKID